MILSEKSDTQVIAALQSHGVDAQRVSAPFALWLVRALDGPQDRLAALLSEAEQARAARFAVDALARRYRAAHGALRLLVEESFGQPAAKQVYDTNAHGKPHLHADPAVQCNISYSAGQALIGLSSGPQIGIDIEHVRPIPDATELAALHYTQNEIDQLKRCPSSDLDRAFLSIWVRKEACSKALGKGLSIAPSSFDCGLGCGIRSVAIDGEVVESDVIDPKGGFLISWARGRY